jgi:uncharacterized protein involved in tolerance to divalent cations
MATPFVDIWINCPDRAIADAIASAAVGQRLAACANVFAPVASLYQWKGSVEQAEEVPLLLKSRAAHFERVAALVRSLHPDETPSIVATPIQAVDGAYGAWLETETLRSDTGSYHPRRAIFRELLSAGPVAIKLNAIFAENRQIDDAVFDAAKAKIAQTKAEIERTPHQGAGFAILHEGEEGRWPMLHWWVAGGIATQKLWRADLAPGALFVDADPLLMACVWELGLIDFERRAWIDTVMSGKTVSDYTERRFSGEYV